MQVGRRSSHEQSASIEFGPGFSPVLDLTEEMSPSSRLDPLATLHLEPLELSVQSGYGPLSVLPRKRRAAWTWTVGLATRAYVSGDVQRLRVEEAPFGVFGLDDRRANEDAEAERLVPVDVFTDPLAVASVLAELEHRGGLTAGVRLSGGVRRLDLRASRERLTVSGAAATVGYRRRLGKWTPFAYGVFEHIRQERVTVLIEVPLTEPILADPQLLNSDFADFAPTSGFSVPAYRTAGEIFSQSSERWYGTTSFGAGIGLDYALSPRWQIGANGEYLHGRLALGGALRLRLGK